MICFLAVDASASWGKELLLIHGGLSKDKHALSDLVLLQASAITCGQQSLVHKCQSRKRQLAVICMLAGDVYASWGKELRLNHGGLSEDKHALSNLVIFQVKPHKPTSKAWFHPEPTTTAKPPARCFQCRAVTTPFFPVHYAAVQASATNLIMIFLWSCRPRARLGSTQSQRGQPSPLHGASTVGLSPAPRPTCSGGAHLPKLPKQTS